MANIVPIFLFCTSLPKSSNGSISQMRSKISNVQCTSRKISTLLTNKMSSISKNTTLNMRPQSNSKRPTCPNCAKPLSLCLCTRLNTPNLDNKVHVTILQHSLERKHPLNSAKIAWLGLRNVNVYTVTDVMLEAQFDIHQLGTLGSDDAATLLGTECTSSVCVNASQNFDCEGSLRVNRSQKWDFDRFSDHDAGAEYVGIMDSQQFSGGLQENIDDIVKFEGNGASAKAEEHLLKQCDAEIISSSDALTSKDAMRENNEPLLSIKVGKYGEISNISHHGKLQDDDEITPNNLDHLITTTEFMERFAEGFVVKKLQKKQRSDCIELEQTEEFQITALPGSALLFPAQKAVTVEAVNFEVKNLIVLDGTWAKANRMYNENPWLKMLPCVRLDLEKMSMFSEVRHQPKPGYLSTIESVVYALQALGGSEQSAGLTNLLDVFESMVEDQRRYKDNRLNNQSSL